MAKLNVLEIEKEFAQILYDLQKRGYVDTAHQLGILVDYRRLAYMPYPLPDANMSGTQLSSPQYVGQQKLGNV